MRPSLSCASRFAPAAATDGAACSYGNYDRTIACSGYHREQQTAASLFGCWSTDATRKYPIDRMLRQLDAWLTDTHTMPGGTALAAGLMV